jgi:hypothetical protein
VVAEIPGASPDSANLALHPTIPAATTNIRISGTDDAWLDRYLFL